ncbi:PH domain-containing protein [Hathewaya proteolytica DSM 3090]|uniref:PH domain-containing protein n=1 Tax=Hathewaya proteolytica DSM 3090 TaxID=1121331 RepID=A0A1M6JEF6_9CLOT|nr:PH domain-containing protein [Hathewaya proteolytica]SHJ45058.1 PH domain-containing protein [Hathewaya proteolytica DSM 3090]
MSRYKSVKNYFPLLVLIVLIIACIIGVYATKYIESYVVTLLIKTGLIVYTIYEIYYIISAVTIVYYVDDRYIYIKSFLNLRNVKVDFNNIRGYDIKQEMGVKLSGFNLGKMAIGRFFTENVGITRMFVTNDKNIMYFLCDDLSYAITPRDMEGMVMELKKHDISIKNQCHHKIKDSNLNRDPKFLIPFAISCIIVVLIVAVPSYLYFYEKLPYTMPLNFSINFAPLEMGTAKQFVFQQMIYGILNLILILCMYFAAQCNDKYYTKARYKYVIISLVTSIIFFIVQCRIIYLYI